MFTVQIQHGILLLVLRVEFEHKRGYESGPDSRGRGGQTVCRIARLPSTFHAEDPGDEVVVYGEGVANCHVNDNWSYAKGRKLALARAVRKAFKRHPEFQMRLLIWNCYHLTVSGGARFVQPMTGSLTGSYRGVFQYTTQGGTT